MFGKRCKRIRKGLKPYLDRELDPVRREEISLHLEHCGECSRFLEDLNRTSARLGSLEEIEPPAGFAASVVLGARSLQRTDSCPRDAQGGARFWLFTPLGSATAIVFLLGILTGHLVSDWFGAGSLSPSGGDQELLVAYGEVFGEMQPSPLLEGYWNIAAPNGEESP